MLNYNSAVATAELQNNKNHIQNFRMWFKFGLKAQKLLAQGIALGQELLPLRGVWSQLAKFLFNILVEISFLYEYINYNKQPINKDELIKDFDRFNNSNIL